MKMIRVSLIAVVLSGLFALPVWAAKDDPASFKETVAQSGGTWCHTQEIFDARYPHRYDNKDIQACLTEGPCDIATNRDANIPGPGDPVITVRLKFHILCEDNGSNCASTQAAVDSQVVILNQEYAPYGVTFVYETEFNNSSQFRSWADAEESPMKFALADDPEKQCNIYVTYVEGSYSFGTFPWDSQALTYMGGIVMTEPAFGNSRKTLAHELGHCLGLWHTHHGVDEVSPCRDCYETPDGANGDNVGDFCSDTRPTPTNFTCADPPGNDSCSLEPWAPTDPQNYMGYGPDYCLHEFSPQQAGRIHCWFAQELTGWVALGFLADPREGSESVSVNFTYDSELAGYAFKWYFGDGDSSLVENPSHTYSPGIYDVTLTVLTDLGEITSVEQDFVTVWADTLKAYPIEETPGTSGFWLINCSNALPLKELILPVTMTNVTSVLFLDSLSIVGTRTQYFELKQLVYDNRFAGQFAYRLRADNGGGAPPLPPGSGAVALVYYHTKPTAHPGDTSYISMPPLGSYTLNATTFTTDYEPVFNGATLKIVSGCQCPNQGDSEPDGFITSQDLGACIDILFAGDPDLIDPACPSPRFDVDCDGFTTALDLGDVIDYLFAGGAGPCAPCAP